MKMIIEAHLVDDEGQTERVELAAINRELTTDPWGINLAEGKALLAAAQKHLVEWQCQSLAWTPDPDGLWHGQGSQSPRIRHCRCMSMYLKDVLTRLPAHLNSRIDEL